ncbi:MAG: hypothetical protein CMC93_01170 [Flavobacteriaceae bacterium]|nr:hypothetical protein [Flavobacteriaceae bacterium]
MGFFRPVFIIHQPLLFFELYFLLIWFFTFYLLDRCLQKAFFIYKNLTLLYGVLYKSTTDLKRVSRIKHYGDLYIFKTENKNYTLYAKTIKDEERLFLHNFFIKYTYAHGVIFS